MKLTCQAHNSSIHPKKETGQLLSFALFWKLLGNQKLLLCSRIHFVVHKLKVRLLTYAID